MSRSTHSLVLLMTLAFVHHALAQNPTFSLLPLVGDIRRECGGGPNDGQSCTTGADCMVGPECQRVCEGGLNDGLACLGDLDCEECPTFCSGGPDDGLPCADQDDCTFAGCHPICSRGECAVNCTCNYVISAHPGDVITAEFFLSGWSPDGELLQAFQLDIDLLSIADEVRLLGYDRPSLPTECVSDEDCPQEFPLCYLSYLCEGPDHDPKAGLFIDDTRTDYVFFGLPDVAGFNVNYLRYSFGAATFQSTAVPFIKPRYAGSLILEILAEIGAEITIPLHETKLGIAFRGTFAGPIDRETLTIEVVEQPQPAERIPATSTWGLVALSLVLLTGAKVYFGRCAAVI